MFYSKLVNFIVWQTKKASVEDLRKAWPELKSGYVSKVDMAIMYDEAIERVLDNPDNYRKQLRLAIGEKIVDVPSISNRTKLESFMEAQRATLLVTGTHRLSPYWKSLCDDVETRLGMGTMAVGIQTPANKPGLIAHWDEGAVTVTQLAGRKQYRLWTPVVELAQISDQRALTPAEMNRTPYMTVTLKPGDVLFIPRGWVHQAATVGNVPSAHVSIGIIHPDMRGRKNRTFI